MVDVIRNERAVQRIYISEMHLPKIPELSTFFSSRLDFSEALNQVTPYFSYILGSYLHGLFKCVMDVEDD